MVNRDQGFGRGIVNANPCLFCLLEVIDLDHERGSNTKLWTQIVKAGSANCESKSYNEPWMQVRGRELECGPLKEYNLGYEPKVLNVIMNTDLEVRGL